MKILTLNLHCFAEKNVDSIQKTIIEYIINKDIDMCFFQEVAQPFNNKTISKKVKAGNYVLRLKELLSENGLSYDMHYDYSKRGFAIFDEGLAILSKTKLSNKRSYHVSNKVDYHDWHTRMNVSCETFIEDTKISLTSLHLGWTQGDEVFEDQLDLTIKNLDLSIPQLICGDFNVPEGSKEYKYIINKGLKDLYYNNQDEFFHHVTHRDYIDVKKKATRIDYIFSNVEWTILDREIVFKDTRVSDHYGVYIELEVKK